jgi:hypothetical protein
MTPVIRLLIKRIILFFVRGYTFRFILLLLLGFFAYREYADSGLKRRTFVFYSLSDGKSVVEERMLAESDSPELNITRYVQDALLGPATPDTALLFPKETKLRSLLFREGVVYVDLSEDAALPSPEEGDTFQNFYTLNLGIRRNFDFVTGVRFFISGNEAYIEKFYEIFAGNASKDYKTVSKGVDKLSVSRIILII